MNIKVFTNNLKIDITDDLPKVSEFLTRKIKQTAKLNYQFTFDIEETKVKYSDVTEKLFKPLDGKYDITSYFFDRETYNIPNSYSWNVSKTLQGITLSTSTLDDSVGGTWMTFAHEILHCIFKKLDIVNIYLWDPMDAMYVKGILQPYYKNWEPEAIDGNFAYAFSALAPYWSKVPLIQATMPVENSLTPTATLIRSKSTKKQTLGVLTATNGNATFICKTLELPWLDNKKMISCVPTGTYKVKKVLWARKLKKFYQLQDVPGRSGIFIHEGNYYYNYEGCIGLGASNADLNKDGEMDITATLATIAAFDGFMGGKDFTLTII